MNSIISLINLDVILEHSYCNNLLICSNLNLSFIIISFLFLISEKSDFRAIRIIKALINDGITYSIYIVNTPVNLILGAGNMTKQYFNFNIVLENKRLKDQIDQLVSEKKELLFFKNENENLRRVLNIKNKDAYTSIYTKIIHEDTNEFAKNLIITIICIYIYNSIWIGSN